MKEISDAIGLAFLAEPWFLKILVVLAVTALINGIAEFALRQAYRFTKRTENGWDNALVACASRPMLVAIWVVGIAQALRIAQTQIDTPVMDVIGTIRDLTIVACAAWFLLRFIRRYSKAVVDQRLASGDKPDVTTLDAVSKLARLTVVTVAVLITMQKLGFSITSVLTLGGIGGIAVGFAAKDVIANFFGGMTIYLDRPFSVGDWIRSPDKSIEGTVEYISWRHTRIRGFNKNPVYVPNALFTTIVVENPSRMSHRRIKETIGIRYSDLMKMNVIVDDVKAMLRAHEDIDSQQTLIVAFNQFAASSVDFFVYTFTKTTNWIRFHEVKHDVLLKIGAIIEAHGAEIAFPTQTLHIMGDAAPTDGPEPDPDSTPDARPNPFDEVQLAASQARPDAAGERPA